MDNAHCDTLRAKWTSEQCYESLHELLRLVMDVAAVTAMRTVSGEPVNDTAQMTATEVWRLIEDGQPIDWSAVTERIAQRIAHKLWRESVKYEEKKVEYAEHIKAREKPMTARKEQIRNMAENGLTPREWQVVHGYYWSRQTFREIGERIGMKERNTCKLHANALGHLRQALHKMGVYKENCLVWYYGKES
jgi:RNA polymerase sigma factor (sigma-70 family)